MMDKITDLIADALCDARVVGATLNEKLIPLLDQRHRPAAIDISRRISERRIICETFLRDLQALYIRLNQLAAEETTVEWRGHEHDPDCGYTFRVQTDRAQVFTTIADQMVELDTCIAAALDAAEAYSIANGLFDR